METNKCIYCDTFKKSDKNYICPYCSKISDNIIFKKKEIQPMETRIVKICNSFNISTEDYDHCASFKSTNKDYRCSYYRSRGSDFCTLFNDSLKMDDSGSHIRLQACKNHEQQI